ncbi:hypothetical protein [Salmonella enterica]|uniref:hypothetical protein n=1 Tax=Salmonella enterica TaxID=28901 RepID=UPI00211992ED|nr:hypothetical protein [Salmonella enterica]
MDETSSTTQGTVIITPPSGLARAPGNGSFLTKRHEQMKKADKQSRAGWGGKRTGAGAPYGNTNAVKHGERSKRAFFPLEGEERLTPLVGLRARNLILAERIGEMRRAGRLFSGKSADWREGMLIEGLMWQHTRKIMRLELAASRAAAAEAKTALAKARVMHKAVRYSQR